MATVIYDKDAGMCTGVKRSIEGALEVAKRIGSIKKIVTYGELIHNPVSINKLQKHGIEIAYSKEAIKSDSFVIIRAHGIPPQDEEYLKNKGIDYLDLTCPIVKSIHKKIVKFKNEGYKIVIVGHPKHPETIGHIGYANRAGIVISDSRDMEKAIKEEKLLIDEKTLLIAQTTISEKLYQQIIMESKAEEREPLPLYTICPFVIGRQRWIEKMSQTSDAAVIIGGKNSSNTRRLYELAQNNCATFWIVQTEELPLEELKKHTNIVLTAGASTADETIKEVIKKLSKAGFNIIEG